MFDISAFVVYAGKLASFLKTSLNISLANLPSSMLVLFDLAIIIIVAALFAVIGKLTKIELIPMYILAGIVIGPLGFGLIRNLPLIYALSEIGIAFLLFTAGMEISVKKLKETTKPALIIGFIEIVIVFLLASAALLFFSNILSLKEIFYIAVAIMFSSTVVVVKLLADKRELATLHARIILTILILQDIVAILLLAFLSVERFSALIIIAAILKLAFMFLLMLLFKRVITPLLKFCAKNHELMLLVPIALVFLFALLANLVGLSIIVGAFLAGLLFAESDYKIEVEAKLKPLRDFFSTLFFVSLGLQLTQLTHNIVVILPAILFLAIVIKPIVIFISTRSLGFKRITAVATSISLGQLSEFGLIIALQALLFGHITSSTFTLIVLATILTIAITPYTIANTHSIYRRTKFLFRNLDKISEHREKKLEYITEEKKTILLVGCHRMGSILLKHFEPVKHKLLVIDFNPEIIKALIKKRVSCIYGDAGNPELLDRIEWRNIKIVISTVPDTTVNSFLIRYAKAANPKTIVVLTAEKIHDALNLYKRNADYVVLPHMLAGEKTCELINKIVKKNIDLEKLKQQHVKELEKLHRLLY